VAGRQRIDARLSPGRRCGEIWLRARMSGTRRVRWRRCGWLFL
jgi:hypothetical protein